MVIDDVVRTPHGVVGVLETFKIVFRIFGDQDAIRGFEFPFDNDSLIENKLEFVKEE